MTLSQQWSGGVRTRHGMHIHNFPNCFMMSMPCSPAIEGVPPTTLLFLPPLRTMTRCSAR